MAFQTFQYVPISLRGFLVVWTKRFERLLWQVWLVTTKRIFRLTSLVFFAASNPNVCSASSSFFC